MANKSKKVQFHKDVKRRRIRRSLTQRIKRLDKKEITYKTCTDQPFQPTIIKDQPIVKVQNKNKVVIQRTSFNLVQSLNARVRNKIDFLLYGMMYIDEQALTSQGQDRSLLRSLFNFYSINYVKMTEKCLIIKIHKNYQNMYPINYVVDRLKSQGNQQFYQIAQMIEKINQRISNMRQGKRASLYDHQIDKYLQRLSGKQSMVMIAPDVMAFSKELLELSGYSIEYIANSCLLNRSFLFDLFLPDNYMEQVKTHMSKFDLSRKYRTGQLSPQQYQQQSCFYNYSSIIDREHNKIKVRSKRYNLEPGIVYWEIEQIVSKEKLINYHSINNCEQKIQYQQNKLQQNCKQVNALMMKPTEMLSPLRNSQDSKQISIKVCKEQLVQPMKVQHD